VNAHLAELWVNDLVSGAPIQGAKIESGADSLTKDPMTDADGIFKTTYGGGTIIVSHKHDIAFAKYKGTPPNTPFLHNSMNSNSCI